MTEDLRGNIRKIGLFLIGLLIVLFGYVSYIQVVQSNFLAGHPLNRRAAEAGAKIERGRILDRNGKVLAYSKPDSTGRYQRYYPYGMITSHVVGYSSVKYGTAGVESAFNGQLSGTTNSQRFFGPVANLWSEKAGYSVMLTIDANLQEAAYRALGNRRGAIVVLNPRTGAVLAMVSKPGFNPAYIDSQWDTIINDPDSPLLNRTVQGLYPPGSTLKVMIAEAALAEKVTDTHKTYVCQGALKIGPDYQLAESGHKAHGEVNLEDAVAVSCNVTFGTLALELGRNRMAKTFERYGFSRPISGEIQEVPSYLPDFANLGDGDLAQTAIGQGGLLVTPIRMAMLASGFANKGIIMEPYLVSKIIATDGTIINEFSPDEFITPTSPVLAGIISRMMVTAVSSGTGTGARIPGVRVAGKTGTAENPHGVPHAWFIGFAPSDNPEIAVAVIVENAGAGGAMAAPIARQVIAAALR